MIISGSITDLFVHCTALGLASIIQEETQEEVSVHWVDQGHIEVFSNKNLTDDEMAAFVQNQALKAVESVWLNTDVHLSNDKDSGKLAPKSPLSPRVASKLNHANYKLLDEARRILIDSMDDPGPSRASMLLVGNLGRSAYWSYSHKGKQLENKPDNGATYWEMSDRRRGDDFVRCRLRELAKVVASRNLGDVKSGLIGTLCRDERAKSNVIESTTATGLRSRGKTDNAQAWCSLWAITLFPTRPVVSSDRPLHSNTVGAASARKSDVHFCMPIFEKSVSLDRVRGVLRTSAFYRVSMWLVDREALLKRGASEVGIAMDQVRLKQQGVTGVVVFPRKWEYVGNAVNYWAEEGIPYLLASSKEARRHG